MDKWLNKIHCMDCLEGMKQLPDNCVDLVFADPPFNVGKSYSLYKDKRSDYFKWMDEWVSECFRVLRDTGSFYMMNITKNIPGVIKVCSNYGDLKNIIIWKNASSGSSKNVFWSFYQPILFYVKSDDYIFNTYFETKINQRWSNWLNGEGRVQRGQLGDIWDDIPNVYVGSVIHKEAILVPGTNRKEHLCQMPEKLARRLIGFSSPERGVVLDPFMGSGTTAVACKQLGRDFIGFEIDSKYVKLANRRFKQEVLYNWVSHNKDYTKESDGK